MKNYYFFKQQSNMKKQVYFIALLFCVTISSCSVSNISMKQPNNHIEFYKNDFDYSPQVTGEATSVKVLMIDWERLFSWKSADVSGETTNGTQVNQPINVSVVSQFVTDPVAGVISAVIPVLGDYGKGEVSNFALYDMMKKNPGYDVVLYPQYETKKFVIPFLYSKTTVKATARLGKIKQ